jgi:hypothetical protein
MLERPGSRFGKSQDYSREIQITKPQFIQSFAQSPNNGKNQPTSVMHSRYQKPPSRRQMSWVAVYGMGCTPRQSGYPNYFIECDTNMLRTVRDIAKATCTRTSTASNFVQHVYKRVKTELEKGHSVALVGHSYGGSVVSRVAKLLVNHPLKTHVRITTCGSIETTNPRELPGIDIHHVMALNDVALKCNGLDPKRDTFVTWLNPYSGAPVPKPRKSVLGTGEEWAIHRDTYGQCFDDGMRWF